MTEFKNKLTKLSEMHGGRENVSIPDLRNWVLKDEFERPIGRVKDLLLEQNRDLVRYIHIVLDPDSNPSGDYKSILLPSGLVRADLDSGEIFLYELEHERLAALPVYNEAEVTPEFENEIIEMLIPEAGKIARNPDDFYSYEHFNTRIF